MVDAAALDQAVNDVLQLAEFVIKMPLSSNGCIVGICEVSMAFAS